MGIKQQIRITTKPELLREYMKKEHLTQEQFALACGVSRAFICNTLQGKSKHQTKTLGKVLKVAGITFEEFFDVEFLF